MTPVEQQLQTLKALSKCANASLRQLPSGAHLVTIPDIKLPPGWNKDRVTIHFVTPPGYPAAQPDCFWLAPPGVRLANNGIPQNSNDTNPIPEVGSVGTWFSWHLQSWNPNSDSLVTFFNVIMQRLRPAR
jgi:hypothetical protein